MATPFQHPFQCIRFLERQQNGLKNLFVASAGSKIYSYSAEGGERLAIWSQDVEPSNEDKPNEPATEDANPESQGPPEKKKKPKPILPGDRAGEVPLLIASSDGQHVVALTSEDKCIRVFAVREDGSLEQLSARCMPKRPSAIDLACDDSMILCADKFGDVYSLPLIPGEKKRAPAKAPAPVKTYHPTATNLTVHTKRNRAALEQQLLQSNQNAKAAAEKDALAFESRVLLGHVSLLTDVVYVSFPLSSSGAKRSYILSADRDEHIRVSRGPPQAHVIENYCFGHTSFISKLCVPQWAPEYLISGGGDNFLLVWKWVEGQMLQKVSLVDEASEKDIVVRGIWATQLEGLKLVLVSIEGTSQLLCYTLESNGSLTAQRPIQVSGNVINLTSNEKTGNIVISIDGIHEPNSTQNWRSSLTAPQTLLESFRVKSGPEGLEWEPANDSMTSRINTEGTSELTATEEKQRKALDESLYSLRNLRKGGHDDE